MKLITTDGDRVTIAFSNAELSLVNNALNEVANGIDISDAEFHARLGEARSEAQRLLAEIGPCIAAKPVD